MPGLYRVRLLACLARASLALASLALAVWATPAGAQMHWGVNGHPLTSYPGVSITQQLDYLKDLGARSYRVNVISRDSIPALAELIEEGKRRDITILPVLTPDDLKLRTETPEQLYRQAFDFAVALVSRFKDDIRVWELGNEMENFAIIRACEMRDNGERYRCDWGPAGGRSALDYYGPRWAKVSAVLKGLSDGTASVDPHIRRAMGTAGWGHVGAFERMQRDGIAWDISVWHMYGQDPEWAFKILAGYGKPIWVTEFNHPYGSQNGARQQAEGLARTMTRLRELQAAYRVEAAFIYELLDETYWAPSFEGFMGLVRLVRDGRGGWAAAGPKPAYQAVKRLLRGTGDVATPRRDCEPDRIGAREAARSTQIAYGYCLILGRVPDSRGRQGWMGALKRGRSPSDMLLALAGSDEFRQKYAVFGLSDAAFVTLAHRLLLAREPTGAELARQTARLVDKPLARSRVFADIVGSREFATRHRILSQPPPPETDTPPADSETSPGRVAVERRCDLSALGAAVPSPAAKVDYSYCLILGRAPDGAGRAGWIATLESGTGIDDLVAAMAASREFDATHRVPALSQSRFVELIYPVLLGRAPDGASRASYAAQLDSGLTDRPALRRDLIGSREFRTAHAILFAPVPDMPAPRPERAN